MSQAEAVHTSKNHHVEITPEPALDRLLEHAQKVTSDFFIRTENKSSKKNPSLHSCDLLTAEELQLLHTLLDYVADHQATELAHVQALLENHFGDVPMDHIARDDFDDAVEFLLDMRIDDMRSRR